VTRRTPLERAIKGEDWERAALYALLAMAVVLRDGRAATIDDLIAALTEAALTEATPMRTEEEGDGRDAS
jgi:hypothetical protein